MTSSADLLYRVNQVLCQLGTKDDPLDETSRQILLQIACDQDNGRVTTVSDVTGRSDYGTAPTVYARLKKLSEHGLIASRRNPSDGRSNILSLTSKATRLIGKCAEAIRAAARA